MRTPPTTPPTWRRCVPWLAAAVLVMATLAVYAPCLHGPFLWDDRDWTIDAEWLMSSASGLWQIWIQPTVLQQYYPVTASTFWLDYHLWGYHTLPYHLENVLCHAISTVLFWRLLAGLAVPGAWFAAALLAVHPVMVESVAWITERKNVLCLVLFLASLLAYAGSMGWWKDRNLLPRWRMHALALLLFVLAMLAKVTAFIMPPVVLLLAWWKLGRLTWRRDLLPALPFLLVAVVLGAGVAWIEKHHLGAKGAEFDLAIPDRIVLAGQALWFYAGKLLWPVPVCVLYYRWPLNIALWWQWLPLACAGLAAFLMWRFQSRLGRGPIAALLIFAGALMPVLGFMNVYGMRFAWVADRWTYIPALPCFALVGAGLARLAHEGTRRVVMGVILAALGILTWRQAATYRSVETFWDAAVAGNRSPWKAQNDYGVALLEMDRYEDAVQHFREAMRLAPNFADARANYGNALLHQGDAGGAVKAWEEALAIKPNLAVVHFNLALVLKGAGKTSEAIEHLQTAIKIVPTMTVAHLELGNIFFFMNRLDDAEAHFRSVLQTRPGHPDANTSLGNVQFRRGKPDEALKYYEQALARAPNLIQALSNCAWIMSTSPNSALRNGARAVTMGEKAVSLTGQNDPAMLEALAAAYAEAGRYEDAVRAANKALQLAEARNNRGMAANLRAELSNYESSKPFRDG